MKTITQTEQFMPVVGFEGLYEVSSAGRIRSITRTTCSPSGKKQTTHGREKSALSNGNGYMSVRLYKDGKETIKYVHRIVLESFIGPPADDQEACHNDGNRSNNRIDNLRWDSKINNHADKRKHGTLLNGEKARHAKLTPEKVIKIRRLIKEGNEQQRIADMFSVSQTTISEIAARRTWKHI